MSRLMVFCALGLCLSSVQAWKFSGNAAAELQWFPNSAQFDGQMDENLTFSFQPKTSHEWNNRNDLFSMELFFRLDDKDENRQHADIRELKWLHVSGDNEWRLGIDTVFWGVTESQHLVDVINQTDRVEGFDGEDKLGQPMLHYTRILDDGVFHAFLLAGFREPEFRSLDGRLRFPLPVDADRSIYQSSDEEKHLDVALRYKHFFGDSEIGLSLFKGTNRDPLLIAHQSQSILIPYYEQMSQFGLDLQTISGNWIWKLEAIYRDVDSGSFSAATGGFEYTFYGIVDSAVDMGTLVEYSVDDRSENTAVLDNDLFAGLRFAFNDVQSSEVLAGFIFDIENDSNSLRVESSRRLGDEWKVTAELQLFNQIDEADPLFAFSQDDFLLIELARYF